MKSRISPTVKASWNYREELLGPRDRRTNRGPITVPASGGRTSTGRDPAAYQSSPSIIRLPPARGESKSSLEHMPVRVPISAEDGTERTT